MKTLPLLIIWSLIFLACGTELPNISENNPNQNESDTGSGQENPDNGRKIPDNAPENPDLEIPDSFSQIGQAHYYEVAVDSGENLFVKLEYDYRQNYYLFVKFGSTPTRNDFDASSTTGDDQLVFIEGTQAGVYYIMVYASSHFPDYSGEYTLAVRSNLDAMSFNTPIDQSFSNFGQKDYYRIEAVPGQNLFVKLEYDYRQNYYLYASYGKPPTRNDFEFSSTTGEDELISVENAQAGIYYIMVYASAHFVDYPGDYTIIATNNFN
jgi:hypothetical protein